MAFFCCTCHKTKETRYLRKKIKVEGKTTTGLCRQCFLESRAQVKPEPERKELETKGKPQYQTKPKPKPKRYLKKYSTLCLKRRQIILREAQNYLNNISRGNLNTLLFDLIKKFFGQELHQFSNLKNNIQQLFSIYKDLLPEPSRIAALLTLGLPLKEAENLTKVPRPSISWGRSQINNLSYFRFQTVIAPNKPSEEELNWFKDFAFEIAPVRSGTEKERRIPFNTYSELYLIYKQKAQETGHPVRVISTMIEWLKELKIKKNKFDRYRCETCYNGRVAESNLRKGIQDQALIQSIEKYLPHQQLVQHQLKQYKSQKDSLDSHELLFVHDYSTIHEFSREKYRDLCIMMLNQNEPKVFFDNLAVAPHDYKFTQAAWIETIKELIQTQKLDQKKKLIIWSDGGLKTKENIYFFSQVATAFQLNIILNYFAPNHGHSEVDGHFGCGKRHLRNSGNDGPITNSNQIIQSFSKLPNTLTKQIVPVNTPLHLKPLAQQIRKWFEWWITPSGQLFCREKTGQGSWVQQHFVLKPNV